MPLKEKKNIFYFFSNITGISLILITSLFIIFFPLIFNPELFNSDYYSYFKFFQVPERYFKLPLFSFYASINFIFNKVTTYDRFRALLSSFQLLSYFYILRKLQFKPRDITLFMGLLFSSFFLFKVYIQIRESLAILIWFYFLIGINSDKNFTIKNICLFILGIGMHIGTIILWFPTLSCLLRGFLKKYTKTLILLFFIFVAFFACNSSLRVLVNPGLIERLNIKDLSPEYFISLNPINFTFSKFLYWFSYLLLFFLIYFEELKLKSLALSRNLSIHFNNILGYISLNGLLVFAPTIIILSFILNINSADYNLIHRVSYILLFILSVYRNIVYPQRFLTSLLSTAIGLDTFRLLLT